MAPETRASAAKARAESPKLGVFVGEQQNWTFFGDLFEDLRKHYSVDVFCPKVYETPLLYGRLNRWSYCRRVRSILERCDVAFYEWASEILEVASHMSHPCPSVVRLHSFELYAWAPRVDWGKVDRVVLVSNAMKKHFSERYPAEADKTTVVYNGVSLDKFKPALRTGELSIGMLGSIIPRKRVYEAILTFSRLRRQGLRATFHLGGGGIHGPGYDEYYVACRRLVQKLELCDCVHFHEHVSDTADWLRSIDVFISNSYWEGQQVALLEALASGCYCLSHSWMGADEVLPSAQICTTDEELGEKIMVYAELPASVKSDRRAAMRQIAKDKFDIERQKEQLRDVIDSVLVSRRQN